MILLLLIMQLLEVNNSINKRFTKICPGYMAIKINGHKRKLTFCVFVLTDFDPCMKISCNYFAVCKAFGPRDARCLCVDNCPSYEETVCSSNGTTYDNECVFRREMCHLKANFTLYHPGACTGNVDPNSLLLAKYIPRHFH